MENVDTYIESGLAKYDLGQYKLGLIIFLLILQG